MRKRQPVITTKLLISVFTPKGFHALKKLLRCRTNKELCQRAVALLGSLEGQAVYTLTPKGRRWRLTELDRKPLHPDCEPGGGPVITWHIPGISAEWTLGPRSHEGFKSLQRRYGIRTKTKLLEFALEVLRNVVQGEINGARVTRADGTVLSVLPSEYGLKTQPRSLAADPVTSTSPTTATAGN